MTQTEKRAPETRTSDTRTPSGQPSKKEMAEMIKRNAQKAVDEITARQKALIESLPKVK